MSSPEAVTIHPPGSKHPSLANTSGGFDRRWFMGRWGVAWSTLSMWQGSFMTDRICADVRITYRPQQGDDEKLEQFDSDVESWKESAPEDSDPSIVRGQETLTPGANGATFDWQGKSYLFFVWSHWEVLGYGKDEKSNLEWAVTYFSKTWFTSSGIDIYIRAVPSAKSVAATGGESDMAARDALIKRVAEALQACEDETVSNLAKTGFSIPGRL